MTEDELSALVIAAQGGDAGALDEVLTALGPLVARRCARMLPCPEDAEEAAQDALVAIATHLGGFRGQGSVLGWATVIASNSARSTYRSLKRRAAEHAVSELPARPDPRTTSVIAGSRSISSRRWSTWRRRIRRWSRRSCCAIWAS